MLTDRHLLQARVEALFTRDGAGRLVRINEPDGGRAPRFFVGRTEAGADCWFRDDLETDVIRELEARVADSPGGLDIAPTEIALFESILARRAHVKWWSGPAFRFPQPVTASDAAVRITPENADLLRPLLAGWRDGVEHCQPLCAVVVEGRAVAICGSVRRSPVAHEAGVATVPEYSRRGFGARAVRAWASAVSAQDRLPLYSTEWNNTASRALAQRLGLVHFATDLAIV